MGGQGQRGPVDRRDTTPQMTNAGTVLARDGGCATKPAKRVQVEVCLSPQTSAGVEVPGYQGSQLCHLAFDKQMQVSSWRKIPSVQALRLGSMPQSLSTEDTQKMDHMSEVSRNSDTVNPRGIQKLILRMETRYVHGVFRR